MKYLVPILIVGFVGLLILCSLNQIEEAGQTISQAKAARATQVAQTKIETAETQSGIPDWATILIIVAISIGVWAATRVRGAPAPYSGPIDTTPIRTGSQGESSSRLFLLILGVVLGFAFLCIIFFSLL